MGSGVSTNSKKKNQITQFESTRKKNYYTGDHKTHVSEGLECLEGDLHTRTEDCEKNPDHTEFIPVDTFTLEHLPKGQRDNDLYEFIKAVADLTVKISVKMTSPHRPEFWPKSTESYPFYNMKGPDVRRTGSGMFGFMYIYEFGVNQWGRKHRDNCTKCPCTKCKNSHSPNNVWWEFDIFTAAHLIFDDLEAGHTSLRLFYDNKDSPVVIIDKVTIGYVNIEYDRCRLRCVTCDHNLGNKLGKIFQDYLDAWYKVELKYKKYKDVDKLMFIVSHPHGCFKQISLGHWMEKYKVDEVKRRFTYTTCTCPGSSGAKVYCVGFNELNWSYYLLVHSGTNSKQKYNYSGVGW